jgi:drug/metabolite transporter (DMT)-like permease
MPVLILPFSVLMLRETVTPRAVLGAVLSVIGVGLLVI